MDISIGVALSAGLGTAVAIGFIVLCVWGFEAICGIRRKPTEEDEW